MPGEYGTARHPLFIFQTKYWRSFFADNRDYYMVGAEAKPTSNSGLF